MKLVISVLAICLAAPAVVRAEDEEAVVTLGTDNFTSFIEQNPLSLVEFYAPWCGHCKRLAPEYEKAAKKLKESGGPPLAKVDATQEKELAEKYEVRGYPTIKFFRNGQAEEYDGGRTEPTIIEWIEKRTGPAVRVVTGEELEKLKKDKDILMVAFVKDQEAELFKTYEKVADKNRDLALFIAVVSGDAKDEVIAYRTDEDPTTCTGKSADEIEAFVKDESFPLFGAISGENYSKYVSRSQDLVWACMSPDDAKKHGDAMRSAASKFRQSYSMVHLNTEEFGSHAENALGVSEFPAVVVQKKSGRYVYPTELAIEAEKLVSFLEDVSAGKVEKAIKSEAIPEKNDEAVKVVVAKNFEEMVLRDDKDVMLEVYAPWCGHCKKLEPVYKEFAEKLQKASIDHIVVAKMDGTANESPVEGFDWSGFPTIFWIPAGAKGPSKYNGARTTEGLLKWVKEKASKPVVHDEL
ncbi:unnamed protein product [Vitrella brassicaformis CCMP3155]|uniref:Protein disulfide-isomerase n=1 Tax=Vitrella brassicaformis (strain CCMP3155) TaxID=1169540 RepID=A0A0G4EK32_VITBC|nr:unnamed protein product [Vitrella brassicaformis CCMP3155]|mmetsp:Transcript_15141/g.36007  ORF Transcript_15141/g.36007 Transcript_15141/m.36007 type:complete len:465 (-) Transcript_15141:1042-2436(-)|eukprot:CEL96760.1 unnamed protein product [Vitrella brassicaformis CCMP3155]